jgi:methionine synthase II (cobalamin-independent)
VSSHPRPWPPASATGLGSLPGTDIRAALRLVLDELPDLPYLPELPARGPAAGVTGRGVALLAGLHAGVQPSGWRIEDRPGLDERRATAFLREDLDTLEEFTQGHSGPVKVQAPGPWTTAATLELPRGAAALSDPGACRDITGSLAEGLAAHVAEVRRRVPDAAVVLQLDEPALPAVLAGSVRRVSGFGTWRAVDAEVAEDALRQVIEAAGATVVGHCCAPGAPIEAMRRVGAAGISVDASLLTKRDDEQLGEAVDAGLALFLGALDAAGPQMSDLAGTVDHVRTLWRRLGFSPGALAEAVVVTPACGLAGASEEQARAAMARSRAAAKALADDPEG